MSEKKSTAVAKAADQSVIDQLNAGYPTEAAGMRIQLPRLGMVSQDVTKEEGKGRNKKIEIVQAAGTFFIERQSDEEEEVEDEDGNIVKKKKWIKDEIGEEIEGIIFYKRYQLRMYDEATEQYTSSPIYDTEDEVIPLFCNKSEVARGTPAELKAKYMFTDKEGKQKSKLEDNRILYVFYEGENYQMNLRGSSMYSFMTYQRKQNPSTTVTKMSSEAKEKGTIAWNQMTFTALRPLTAEEAEQVLDHQNRIKAAITVEKASYAAVKAKDGKDEKDMNELVAGATKKF